jgi:hypothetical protein
MLRKSIFFVIVLLASISYGQTSLFPVIPDWQVTVEEQVYDSNNLWDLIDGAADLFLEYSFVDLHLARYKGVSDIEIKAELYKHTTPLNAFGIYSQERDPGYKYIRVGVQGYIEEGILNFLDGVYYIKLSTLQKGDTAQNALMLVAKNLDEHLKQVNSFPSVLNYFPAESKLANSEKYTSQNYLGHSFLKSVTTVKYGEKNPFTAFILNAETEANAVKVLNQFMEAVSSLKPFNSGDNHFQINDPQNGMIEIAIQKRFLYGVINCSDKEKREKLLKEIKTALGKIK